MLVGSLLSNVSLVSADGYSETCKDYYLVSKDALDEASKTLINSDVEKAALKEEISALKEKIDKQNNPNLLTKFKNILVSLLKYGTIGLVVAVSVAAYMDRAGKTNIFSKYLNMKFIKSGFTVNELITHGINNLNSSLEYLKSFGKSNLDMLKNGSWLELIKNYF